ncbi:hypothetical protein Bbelb_042930 [Branchiostoma belcheri]|nr:hypothetical protein Bbelb_042930 [Branchiostoma belcheri]
MERFFWTPQVTQHLCVKHAFPRCRVSMEGKNERVKIPPRKTRHVRFGVKQKCYEAKSRQRGHDSTVCEEDDMDKVIDLEGEETDDRLWEAETVPDHVPVCAVGPVCVPVHIPGESAILCSRRICLCVFLRDLSPIYETREHYADPETGLQQEEEPDFCRKGCVKEDVEVWEADTVYLTMWDLSIILCVLSAILCTCPGGPVCVPVGPVHWITFQEDLCSCLFQEDVPVFLRDLSPATRQVNIGLDREFPFI